MLEEPACRLPNGTVTAVPKLLRSIIDHNPNVFSSPPKPKLISTFKCISLSLCRILKLLFNANAFILIIMIVINVWYAIMELWTCMLTDTSLISCHTRTAATCIHRPFSQWTYMYVSQFFLSLLSLWISEKNHWISGTLNRTFYRMDVLPVTQWAVLKYWKEHETLTITSGMTSSISSTHRLLVGSALLPLCQVSDVNMRMSFQWCRCSCIKSFAKFLASHCIIKQCCTTEYTEC